MVGQALQAIATWSCPQIWVPSCFFGASCTWSTDPGYFGGFLAVGSCWLFLVSSGSLFPSCRKFLGSYRLLLWLSRKLSQMQWIGIISNSNFMEKGPIPLLGNLRKIRHFWFHRLIPFRDRFGLSSSIHLLLLGWQAFTGLVFLPR